MATEKVGQQSELQKLFGEATSLIVKGLTEMCGISAFPMIKMKWFNMYIVEGL